MDEGDEDESLFDDWNDMRTSRTSSARRMSMLPVCRSCRHTTSVRRSMRTFRSSPATCGVALTCTASCGALPGSCRRGARLPPRIRSQDSGDGVDCAGVEEDAWGVEEDAWRRIFALHEEQRILAHLPCRKLPRGDPWAVYSDAPVPDLDGEASTGGSE